jgi:Ribonuclease G/E
VQVSKEPLGKKGARITSHIALPWTVSGVHADRGPRRRIAQDLVR